jgi:hypothetical protein
MYKFMQRNRKKMLAVFAVGLMIVFILPQVAFDKTRGTSREVIGHVGGEAVHAGEVRSALEQWRSLSDYQLTAELSLVGQDMEDHPELFVLLQTEARQLGLRPPESQIDELLSFIARSSAMRGMPSPNLNVLKPALENLMLVRGLFQRVAVSLKPSGPLVTRELADQNQRIKLALVHYSADDFKKDVPAPTEDQLKEQFEKFKESMPGVATSQNPFGFGYRSPATVQ